MAKGTLTMAEPNFSVLGDDANDDLPLAFRREKEARAREAMERQARERAAAGPSLSMGPSAGPDTGQNNRPEVTSRTASLSAQPGPQAGPKAGPQVGPQTGPQTGLANDIRPSDAALNVVGMPATVKRFDVPFSHLVRFFLKCAVAAIPALILLGCILWLLGALSTALFPNLVKLKILIGFGS